MREHMGLYRGKKLCDGKWVSGNLLTFLDGRVSIHYYVEGCRVSMEVDPDTVGECTALRDKNGKLIFEGDIVRVIAMLNDHHQCGASSVMVVRYWMGNSCVCFAECESGMPIYPLNVSHKIEIIGNIHDNPELLKGGEGDG